MSMYKRAFAWFCPKIGATECPFECGEGGPMAIWAMPKWTAIFLWWCFPKLDYLSYILHKNSTQIYAICVNLNTNQIIWGWNHIAFRDVFQEIYAADKKIYATAGRTGRAKYQLCCLASAVVIVSNKLLLLLVDSTVMTEEKIKILRKILTWECQRWPLREWAKLVRKVFSLGGMFARSGPFQSRPEMCGDVYLLLQTCIYFSQPNG